MGVINDYAMNLEAVRFAAQKFSTGKMSAHDFKVFIYNQIGAPGGRSMAETLDHLAAYIAKVKNVVKAIPLTAQSGPFSAQSNAIQENLKNLHDHFFLIQRNPEIFKFSQSATKAAAESAKKVQAATVGHEDVKNDLPEVDLMSPQQVDAEIARIRAQPSLTPPELQLLKMLQHKKNENITAQVEELGRQKLNAQVGQLANEMAELRRQQEQELAKAQLQEMQRNMRLQQEARQKEEQAAVDIQPPAAAEPAQPSSPNQGYNLADGLPNLDDLDDEPIPDLAAHLNDVDRIIQEEESDGDKPVVPQKPAPKPIDAGSEPAANK